MPGPSRVQKAVTGPQEAQPGPSPPPDGLRVSTPCGVRTGANSMTNPPFLITPRAKAETVALHTAVAGLRWSTTTFAAVLAFPSAAPPRRAPTRRDALEC